MKKLRLLLASTLLLLTGCTPAQVQTNPSNTDGEQEVAKHNYEISETELTLTAGQSTKLYISDNGTLVSNITWKSSNTKIAVVDSSGLVTGVKEGEATITGTIDKDNSFDCVVTITPSEVTHSYEISDTKLSIKAGQSTKLYISDNGTIVSNITWKSSNTKIAVVDSSGLVTGVKEGEATITGTIDKDNSFNCVVTVTSSEVTPPGPDDDKDTEIVKFFKKNADYVSGTSYYFVSAKSKWDYQLNQSLIWEMYFEYNTSNDICVISSKMNFTTSSGLSCFYYGFNTFYWGSYKNGLFTGGYKQEKSKGSGTYYDLEFEFNSSTIIFRTDYSLTYVDLKYSVENNDFSSSPSLDDVRAAFSRVSECCSYANEMFTKFNVNLKLY